MEKFAKRNKKYWKSLKKKTGCIWQAFLKIVSIADENGKPWIEYENGEPCVQDGDGKFCVEDGIIWIALKMRMESLVLNRRIESLAFKMEMALCWRRDDMNRIEYKNGEPCIENGIIWIALKMRMDSFALNIRMESLALKKEWYILRWKKGWYITWKWGWLTLCWRRDS